MDFPALPLRDLPDALRKRAALLVGYAPAAARAYEDSAVWLETCLDAQLDETLTVSAAAREAGWSYEGLRRRVVEGGTLNAGTARSPRIRRRDLQTLGPGRGPRPVSPEDAEANPEAESAPPGSQETAAVNASAPERSEAARERAGQLLVARRPAARPELERRPRRSAASDARDTDPMDAVFSRILDRAVNS